MPLTLTTEDVTPQLQQQPRTFRSSDWQMLLALQFAASVIVGIYAIATQRYLYGDGAYFLIMILQQRDVLHFDFARHFAHWLTQFPAVFLMRTLESRDIRAIGAVYGATLVLLPLVGLLLTWWAARRARGDYLLYPLITSSILFLDVSFFSISESLIGVALFFPMLYLLLLSDKLNVARSTALIVLAVLATRTYECYLLLAWPLVIAAIRRGKYALDKKNYVEVLTCGVCGLLFLAAFAISLYSVLYPLNSDSRANFFLSALLHLAYPPVWFSLLTLSGVFSCLFYPHRQHAGSLHSRMIVGCGLLVMLLPLCGFVAPPLQYISRIQCLYVPLALGCAVVLKSIMDKSATLQTHVSQAELWKVTGWACLVSVVFQLGATWRWDEYRYAMLRDLREQQGAIPFNQSAVYASVFERRQRSLLDEFTLNPSLFTKQLVVGQFNWGWALPSLSVILSATNLGSVSSIICAPESEGWQPFDPQKAETIPDLSGFGIKTELTGL